MKLLFNELLTGPLFEEKEYNPTPMQNSAVRALTLQPSVAGRIYYTNMIGKAAPGVIGKSLYLYQLAASESRFFLVANAEAHQSGRMVVFDARGELLNSQLIEVCKGKNTIELSATGSGAEPHLIAVYLGGQLAFMQKLT